MKTISSNLLTHIQSQVTTLAGFWLITRLDGTVIGFTNLDKSISYDGVTYTADTGFSRSDIEARTDLSVDDLDIESFVDSSYITEEDLEAGLYDGAEIKFFMLNYKDTSMGIIKFKRGWIGDVDIKDGMYVAQLAGLTQALQNNIVDLLGPECQAQFGDSNCGFDKNTVKYTGTVESVTSRRVFTTSFAHPEGDNQFKGGEAVFTSGANQNITMEIRESTASSKTLGLFLSAPFTVNPGDGLTVYQGCAKNPDACKAYNNYSNYYLAYPYAIREDALHEVPKLY